MVVCLDVTRPETDALSASGLKHPGIISVYTQLRLRCFGTPFAVMASGGPTLIGLYQYAMRKLIM